MKYLLWFEVRAELGAILRTSVINMLRRNARTLATTVVGQERSSRSDPPTSVDPPIPDEIAATRKSAVPCQEETHAPQQSWHI